MTHTKQVVSKTQPLLTPGNAEIYLFLTPQSSSKSYLLRCRDRYDGSGWSGRIEERIWERLCVLRSSNALGIFLFCHADQYSNSQRLLLLPQLLLLEKWESRGSICTIPGPVPPPTRHLQRGKKSSTSHSPSPSLTFPYWFHCPYHFSCALWQLPC